MTVRTRLRVKLTKQSEDGTTGISDVVPKLEEPRMETGQTAHNGQQLQEVKRLSVSNFQTWLYRVHCLLGGPVCSTTEMVIVYLLVAGMLALTGVGAYKQLTGLGATLRSATPLHAFSSGRS